MMKNEDVTTSMIEDQTKMIPSVSFLALAIGAMAVSAGFALAGRVKLANFFGQWVPSILIIGTYNKIAKTFSPPINEEQRLRHGGNASMLKQQPSETRRPVPTM